MQLGTYFSIENYRVRVRDCDDTKYSEENDCSPCPDGKPRNSCGKCGPEPDSTDWEIDDLTDNVTGILEEMLDKARQIQPDLNIIKSGSHSGANTNINCGEINIGGSVNAIESASILAFELSHVINENSDLALNAVFALTRNEFLQQRAEFEAQGKVFSKIVKNEQVKDLNDCEKNKLGSFNSLAHDYTGQSVNEIINSIQQNGDLANETQNVLNGTIPSNNNIPFTDHFGPIYDQWQETIDHYRFIENETNETIRDRFKSDCN